MVLTPSMQSLLRKKLPRFNKAVTAMFTVLMVACAFCGSCTFRSSPKGVHKFVKVEPEGES